MTTQEREPATARDRWRARPLAAGALHAALLLTPVLVAIGVVRMVGALTGSWPGLLRLLLGTVVAVVAAVVVERQLRRFLPLTTQLRMTMLFPDRAPSRLAVARRIGHPRQLASAASAARPLFADGRYRARRRSVDG